MLIMAWALEKADSKYIMTSVVIIPAKKLKNIAVYFGCTEKEQVLLDGFPIQFKFEWGVLSYVKNKEAEDAFLLVNPKELAKSLASGGNYVGPLVNLNEEELLKSKETEEDEIKTKILFCLRKKSALSDGMTAAKIRTLGKYNGIVRSKTSEQIEKLCEELVEEGKLKRGQTKNSGSSLPTYQAAFPPPSPARSASPHSEKR